MTLIKPLFKNHDFLIEVYSFDSTTGSCLWWLGQSGFLIKYQKLLILIDPYLSDSLTRKYELTDLPHVRMSERVVAPEHLKDIDLVIVSHLHTDHFDPDTLDPIRDQNINCKIIVPEASRNEAMRRLKKSSHILGISGREMLKIDGILIYSVPSAHPEREKDRNGNDKYLGFILELNSYRIYHSGDTLWYQGLESALQKYQVDLALLPINGNPDHLKVAGNLSEVEAARLAKTINAKIVIPCHYNMFEFNTGDVSTFVKEALRLGQEYRILKQGEGFKFFNLN